MERLLEIARQYEGQKEISGRKHNPVIVDFFKKAGHAGIKDDETPWCAAFVAAVLHEAGLPHTKSLLAKSYLKYGDAVAVPEPGDIIVLERPPVAWQGHVGFFVKWDSTHVWLLGGNQRNAVNVAKFPRSSIVGMRRVKPAPSLLEDKTKVTPKEIATTATKVAAGGAAGGAVLVAFDIPMLVLVGLATLSVGFALGYFLGTRK